MGRLSDFLGAFAGNLGNQFAEKAKEKRLLDYQSAAQKMQEKTQIDAENRRRVAANQDRATELSIAPPSVGMNAQGQQTLQSVNASVDPVSGALSAERRDLGPAPVTPVRYGTQTTAAGKVSGKHMSDGTFVPDGEPLKPREPVGRAPPRRRTQIRDVPGKGQVLFDLDTGDEIRVVGPSAAEKPPSAATTDAARSRYLTDLGRIEKAETAEQLATLAKSAGVRLPGRTELGDGAMDESKWLPEAKKIVAAGFQKRFEGQQAPPGATKKKGASQDSPADASDFSGDPPSGTWVRLPSGKVIQVP